MMSKAEAYSMFSGAALLGVAAYGAATVFAQSLIEDVPRHIAQAERAAVRLDSINALDACSPMDVLEHMAQARVFYGQAIDAAIHVAEYSPQYPPAVIAAWSEYIGIVGDARRNDRDARALVQTGLERDRLQATLAGLSVADSTHERLEQFVLDCAPQEGFQLLAQLADDE